MNWYWRYGMSYWIAALGSLLFLCAPFRGKIRFCSTAVRVQLFLFGVVLLLWSGLGCYLFAHDAAWSDSMALAASSHFLHHAKSLLAGIAIGLLASVLLNRDFYSPGKHASPDI